MSETPNTAPPGDGKTTNASATDKPLDKEIHDLMSDTIGPLWEKMKVDTAIVLAKVPGTDKISIYYRGHFYDVATLLVKMSQKFTSQIDRELGR